MACKFFQVQRAIGKVKVRGGGVGVGFQGRQMGNLRSATGNEGCGSGRLVSITSKGKETARTTIISHLEYFLHSGSNIEIEFFAVIVAGSLPTYLSCTL